MSLIKEIMKAADKITDGAPTLEYILILVDELGAEFMAAGVESEDVAHCIRRSLEAATARIEDRGY